MKRWITAISLLSLLISACAPSISEEERQKLEEYSRPYERTTDYQKALTTLGRIVNKGLQAETRFQVEPIVNKTGGKGVPPFITDMVVSSTDTLAGRSFRVVPYHDREYIKTQVALGASFEPLLPHIVISGAITEFDENISLKESGIDIQAYIPFKIDETTAQVLVPDEDGQYITVDIETESRQLDTDISVGFEKAQSISRMTVDFHLIEYTTLAYLPRKHVTNTILVCDLEKGRNFGFIIYGSGISLWGKIIERQGIHQALRNLVDYSMLHLMSLQYHLPFWRALGFSNHPKSRTLFAEWRQEFLRLGHDDKNRDQKILRIHDWLTRYELGEVYVGGNIFTQIPPAEFGYFGSVTQAFTLKFLYQYVPDSRLIAYAEQASFPALDDILADLYITLIKNIPMP